VDHSSRATVGRRASPSRTTRALIPREAGHIDSVVVTGDAAVHVLSAGHAIDQGLELVEVVLEVARQGQVQAACVDGGVGRVSLAEVIAKTGLNALDRDGGAIGVAAGHAIHGDLRDACACNKCCVDGQEESVLELHVLR
jgi:hypothetical protein